jgi:hypothetical protein
MSGKHMAATPNDDLAPGNEERHSATEQAEPLQWLKSSLGLLAGTAAVIYVTGGLVLALRLAFEDIPSLDVVSGLPREFLFSIGVTQVVAPAVLVGAALGLIELGQSSSRLEVSHLGWARIAHCRRLRSAYLGFWSAIPIILLTPAAAYVIGREPIDGKAGLLVLVWASFGLAVGTLLWTWFISQGFTLPRGSEDYVPRPCNWRSALVEPSRWAECGCRSVLKDAASQHIRLPEYLRMLGGVVVWLGVGLWIYAGSNSHAFALFIATISVLSLLVAHLFLWVRGQIGDRARAKPKSTTSLGVFSWFATALLTVPALVAFGSVHPLPQAVVCTQAADRTPFTAAAGTYVGATHDQVYIGDRSQHRMTTIPVSHVTRIIFGKNAGHTGLCQSSTSGQP